VEISYEENVPENTGVCTQIVFSHKSLWDLQSSFCFVGFGVVVFLSQILLKQDIYSGFVTKESKRFYFYNLFKSSQNLIFVDIPFCWT